MIVPEISAELRGSILLGLTGAEGVAIEPSGPALLSEIEDLAHALAAEHFGRPPGEINVSITPVSPRPGTGTDNGSISTAMKSP